MRRNRFDDRRGVVEVAILVLLVAGARAEAQPLLEARIPAEHVAPGGALQIKIEVTEPRPISTGGGSFSSWGDELLGFAVNSPAGDAAAAAVVRSGLVRVRMVSPSASLGLDPDYPILTLTLPVPATAPIGAGTPLRFTGPLVLFDELGRSYPVGVRDGEVTVVAGASIRNVTPGGGVVAAGGTVIVDGVGFDATSEVRLHEGVVSSTRVVNSTRLEATVAAPLEMHGRGVEVRSTLSGQRVTYVAYQRTQRLVRSAHPQFGVTEVAHAQRFVTAAVVPFAAPDAAQTFGVALQNSGSVAAAIALELVGESGQILGRLAATLPPVSHAVVSLAEVFGRSCVAACGVRLAASAPVQFMGLVADAAQDAVVPRPATADAPPRFTIAANTARAVVGDLFVLSSTAVPGPLPLVADVYVVAQAPDGGILSLIGPGRLAAGLRPFAAAATFTGPTSSELLRAAIPPGTPPGSYRWMAALTVPGTLVPLTPISTVTLSIP